MEKFKSLIAAITLFFSMEAFSDVIKWVDDKGKLHYGDKVPEKYKKNSARLQLKTTDTPSHEKKKAYTSKDYFAKQAKEMERAAANRKLAAELEKERLYSHRKSLEKQVKIYEKESKERHDRQGPCVTDPYYCIKKHMDSFEKTQKKIREAKRKIYR